MGNIKLSNFYSLLYYELEHNKNVLEHNFIRDVINSYDLCLGENKQVCLGFDFNTIDLSNKMKEIAKNNVDLEHFLKVFDAKMEKCAIIDNKKEGK